jgi:hypothetical protein
VVVYVGFLAVDSLAALSSIVRSALCRLNALPAEAGDDLTAIENAIQREMDSLADTVREDLRGRIVDQRAYLASEADASMYALWLLTAATICPCSSQPREIARQVLVNVAGP